MKSALRDVAVTSLTLLIAANTAAPAQTVAQLPTWTLSAEARFGSSTDTAAMLISPFLATIGPNGFTYVFDLRTIQVKVYDQNAKFIRIVGRQGQGPGEYNRVSAIGFLGDTLWVADPDARRYTLWPPGNAEPKTFELDHAPPPPAGVNATFSRVMPKLLHSGLAVAQPTLLTSTRAGLAPTSSVANPIVLLRRDGSIASTLATITEKTNERISVRGVNPATGTTGTFLSDQPFRARSYWAARSDGNGVVLVEPPATVAAGATAASFSIRTFDASGRELVKRSVAYQPIPVTARMRDSLIEFMARRGGAGAVDSVRIRLEDSPLLPTITDIRVGIDGSALLKRESTVDGGRRWTIVDPTGTPLANIVLPERENMRYADMNQILVEQIDASGEHWIVRYRISRR